MRKIAGWAYGPGVLPLRFVPDHEMHPGGAHEGLPNVVVDGSPNASTRLTLSHWPGSPTPPELRLDLSAEIAFAALARPELFDGIEAVTNNHADQDGAMSAFALVDPATALARRDLAIHVARAGDFGIARDRTAGRIAMTLAAFEDADRGPFGRELLDGPYPEVCGRLYQSILPLVPELLDHPDRWRHLWEDEDAHLDASLAAIADGTVHIDEHPGLDLAVVHVPDDWARRTASRFTMSVSSALHPMALPTSTDRLRLLVFEGDRPRLELRYESWVMLTSRPVLPRPDLRGLAARLAELDGRPWRADSPGALVPGLEPEDGTGLDPAIVQAEAERFLAVAPAAWDPFSPR